MLISQMNSMTESYFEKYLPLWLGFTKEMRLINLQIPALYFVAKRC